MTFQDEQIAELRQKADDEKANNETLIKSLQEKEQQEASLQEKLEATLKEERASFSAEKHSIEA